MAILPKSNLYVQCNPHINSTDIPHRDWKINPQVHMKLQKTMNNQTILNKKSDTGGITILASKLYYSYKIIMVPAQKQT
jgi:hypothetical protein